MARVLLDTQFLLRAALDRPELPEATRALLLDPRLEPLFSAASIWEVAVKSALGRPDLAVDPEGLARGLAGAGYAELPVTSRHTAAARALPSPGPDGHRDPFDRLLVAQARAGAVDLATADRTLAGYGRGIVAMR